MKRYQEIEIEKRCKKTDTFIKFLESKYPAFYEVWGGEIAYNLEHGIEFEDGRGAGYVLHTIAEYDYFYVCLIAYSEQQVINI